jgi:phospholipase/carboxylesterase
MNPDLTLHHYHFERATSPDAPTLVLLHGTGGDEHDLVPLGQRVAPGTHLLSPRGNVSENGMPRFFRRLAEGVFDLEDLARRTEELRRWLTAAIAHHQLDASRLFALGFSNGANTAANLMLTTNAKSSARWTGAILIRSMVTAEHSTTPSTLANVPILLLSGSRDPIIPLENSRRLEAMLTSSGARVEHIARDVSHQLDHQDLALSKAWADREIFGTAKHA